MESGVKVALPTAVSEARLMGSAEGFGGGGGVVTEVRWHKEGSFSSGDDIHADNASEPPHWNKIPASELSAELCQPSSSLRSNDTSNDSCFQSTNPHVLNLDVDAKPVLQKSCKIVRSNSGYNKKSGVVQMEICKREPGNDINGISPELASSSVCYSISEKVQMVKQKSSTSRRGDKRNSKVKHKNRCDAFSLKNGLVAFNSAVGGNNFFGIYGLKPDVFDITKYVNELSLDELLHGNCSCPSVIKDKGKKAANSNNNLLQSIRRACSVLQAQRGLQVQDCAEINDTCTQKFSNSLVSVSPVEDQTDGDKIDICAADWTSSNKVHESDCKIKKFNVAESPLCQPKDVLERLALPLSLDLDSLLSDTSKTTTLKNSTDSRLGKPTLNRTGLPPFPWSHPFSAHSKLGTDAIKSSTSRAICPGRWVKVNNSPALQKGSTDLLEDFESLTFNQNLVPSINLTLEHPNVEAAPIERVMSTSSACSTSVVPAVDDYSQKCAAAQTLLDIALKSQKNSFTAVKLLKKPSRMAMKVSKLKGVERRDLLFNVPKSTKPPYPSKAGDGSFLSKKLKLSSDVTDTNIGCSEPARKGTLHWSASPLVKLPPRKLFRDSSAGMDGYASNIVKKSISMKPPRGAERPGSSSSSLQKFRKLSH